jgi:hypothetical protein
LRVFVPSYKKGYGFEDAICLPADVQAEVDAAVISAYKETREKAIEEQNVDAKSREEKGTN